MTANIQFAVVAVVLLLLFTIVYAFYAICCQVKTLPERLPEENQDVVWSISLPETSELPSYVELQANPENNRPPGYWTLFPFNDQPVITESL